MTDQRFSDFPLHAALVAATEGLGFTAPTPIQAATLTPLLDGRDVIARARTGSGKTAAFGLPLLHHIMTGLEEGGRSKRPQALVLAPTRELALQVAQALRELSGELQIPVVTVYGGSAYGPQLRALERGVPVVVGTPGRLIDHLERGALDLSEIKCVVLDEADEMLRMGFIDDVDRLLGATPAGRQVALFSATMPGGVARVAKTYQSNPVNVQVESGPARTDHIDQRWICVPQRFKIEALTRVLDAESRGTTLVFARTRAGCAEVADALIRRGFGADALHGDMNQSARERVLHRLRSKWLDIVVATDVAARGIDIDHVTHVINIDLPDNAEPYVHRIGRTGRAGRDGAAITFVTPGERGRWRAFEKHLGSPVPQATVPSDLEIVQRQRASVIETLLEVVEDDRWDDAKARFQAYIEDSGQDGETLGAAVLDLLHRERSLRADRDPSPEPPEWARPPERRPRPERDRPRHDSGGGGGELFIAMGKNAGLRPKDVVGALTHGLKIPINAVGRVTILERKTFVALPPEILGGLLASVETVGLRGRDVRIGAARQRSAPHEAPPAKGKRRFTTRRPNKPSHKPHRGRPKPGKRRN